MNDETGVPEIVVGLGQDVTRSAAASRKWMISGAAVIWNAACQLM
jgi:hypothetical protein